MVTLYHDVIGEIFLPGYAVEVSDLSTYKYGARTIVLEQCAKTVGYVGLFFEPGRSGKDGNSLLSGYECGIIWADMRIS